MLILNVFLLTPGNTSCTTFAGICAHNFFNILEERVFSPRKSITDQVGDLTSDSESISSDDNPLVLIPNGKKYLIFMIVLEEFFY